MDPCKSIADLTNDKDGFLKNVNDIINVLNYIPNGVNNGVVGPLNFVIVNTIKIINGIIGTTNKAVDGTVKGINYVYTNLDDLIILYYKSMGTNFYFKFKLFALPLILKLYIYIQEKYLFQKNVRSKRVPIRKLIWFTGLIILLPYISLIWSFFYNYELFVILFLGILLSVIFLLKLF